MSSTASTNPKYNGTHPCPQCGAVSHWTCMDEQRLVIRVDCNGPCGTFENTYAELQSKPQFHRTTPTVLTH
ncbi:MAG: hypothetical protein JO061_03460 [Acidobacteriaceae bacterium]|nr:hypothetical protein [Acidobacteriaceae bacterium]